MLRWSIVVLLLTSALAFSPVHAQPCGPFIDVSAQDSFCDNVQWIYNRGITLGCTSDQYCPSQFVSRVQMAIFMNRLGNVTFQQGGSAFGAAGRLGTTDDQPVEIIANGARAMRIEPKALSPNLIGGDAANRVTPGAEGATVSGGGYADPSFPAENLVTASFGTVGGGYGNRAGSHATIAGGAENTATGYASVASGGNRNKATGFLSSVSGGDFNTASGYGSMVPGGVFNVAAGEFSFAAGASAVTNGNGSFTWADSSSSFPFGVPDDNFFAVRATGGVGFTVAINGSGGERSSATSGRAPSAGYASAIATRRRTSSTWTSTRRCESSPRCPSIRGTSGTPIPRFATSARPRRTFMRHSASATTTR